MILSIRREPVVVNTGRAIYFSIPLFHVTAKEGTGRGPVTITPSFLPPRGPLDPSACIAKSRCVTPCNVFIGYPLGIPIRVHVVAHQALRNAAARCLQNHPLDDPRACNKLFIACRSRVHRLLHRCLRGHPSFHHPLRRPAYFARSVVLEDVLAGRRAARFKTSSGFSHGVATTCSLPALTAVVDVLIGCLPDIVRFHREGSSVRLWEISTCISHGRQELLTGHLRDRLRITFANAFGITFAITFANTSAITSGSSSRVHPPCSPRITAASSVCIRAHHSRVSGS